MTEPAETRYRKTKRVEQAKAHHENRVQNLAATTVEKFDEFLEENRPACVKGGLPSPWTDWATDPELREDYETEAPTREEARALCEEAECPIRAVEFGGNGLCVSYAKATDQGHGVWGGLAREIQTGNAMRPRARWLHNDKEAHTARRINNDEQ